MNDEEEVEVVVQWQVQRDADSDDVGDEEESAQNGEFLADGIHFLLVFDQQEDGGALDRDSKVDEKEKCPAQAGEEGVIRQVWVFGDEHGDEHGERACHVD